jgi:hypothetical protein
MKFIVVALMLISSSAFSSTLTSFSCNSYDQSLKVTGIQMECQDERYKVWEKNGCYKVTIEDSQGVRELEMVRNLRYLLEEQQGFFSMYTYDEKEWVLESFIVEPVGVSEGKLPRMRFDYRPSMKDPFTMVYGQCSQVIL